MKQLWLIWYSSLAIVTFLSTDLVHSTQDVKKPQAAPPVTHKQADRFTLPPLPYAYDALEPYVDSQTMKIHYTKHHQKYVDELNSALKNHPKLKTMTLTSMLKNLGAIPADIRTAVRNNGGGHANHSLFWQVMSKNGGGTPQGSLKKAIIKTFGCFEAFKTLFNDAAKKRFGSGWAWLCLDPKGQLVVTSTANQDTPLSQGLEPLLCLDVWEHAYYLLYQNRRPDYIESWWHVVNWPYVEQRYQKTLQKITKKQ